MKSALLGFHLLDQQRDSLQALRVGNPRRKLAVMLDLPINGLASLAHTVAPVSMTAERSICFYVGVSATLAGWTVVPDLAEVEAPAKAANP
jgi:hypothetical protein